jgi:hypothetical protein
MKRITKTKNQMKTNIIITLAVMAVSLNFVMANNINNTYIENPVELKLNPYTDLAPVTPREALFNDLVPEPKTDLSKLSPSTPKEAAFDDETNGGTVLCNELLKSLAPSEPKEADFDNNLTPEAQIVPGN